MKSVIIAVCALCAVLSLSSCSSPQLATSEQTVHVHVREYPGRTKAQIFEGVIRHAAATVRTDGQIREKDPEKGLIIIRGSFPVVIDGLMGIKYRTNAHCTVTVDVKDGKARYAYTNIQALTDKGGAEPNIESRADFHERFDMAASFWDEAARENITDSSW